MLAIHVHCSQVLLPHGTIVKIVAQDKYLNVYIVASPYDKHNTSGMLCSFLFILYCIITVSKFCFRLINVD